MMMWIVWLACGVVVVAILVLAFIGYVALGRENITLPW